MHGKRLYITELVLIAIKHSTIIAEERNIKVIIPSHLQITENYKEKFSIMLGKHVSPNPIIILYITSATYELSVFWQLPQCIYYLTLSNCQKRRLPF
jgi:hypothetical protein